MHCIDLSKLLNDVVMIWSECCGPVEWDGDYLKKLSAVADLFWRSMAIRAPYGAKKYEVWMWGQVSLSGELTKTQQWPLYKDVRIIGGRNL